MPVLQRQKQFSVGSRPVRHAKEVPNQPGLQSESLCQNRGQERRLGEGGKRGRRRKRRKKEGGGRNKRDLILKSKSHMISLTQNYNISKLKQQQQNPLN